MSPRSGTDPSVDRRPVAVCLLCVVAVLAGCTATLGDNEELPDSEDIEETYTSLDAYSATFVFTSSGETAGNPGRTGPDRVEGELIVRPGTGEAYREQELGDGSNRQVIVSNGTVSWVYNESANRVRRLETARTDSQRRQLRQIVTRITRNETESDSPLPIVPIGVGGGFDSTSSGSTGGLDVSTVATYEGTETVGGRETHVLAVESTNESAVRGRWTYYLDTEWYVLLRSTSNVTVDGKQTQTSFRLQNVTFDPDVPADRFEFTPPENVTVTGSKTDIERYQSREQLAEVTDLRVPDPDVPARFEFDGARRSLFRSVERISLRYTSDVATLVVSRQNVTVDRPSSDRGQELQVGERTGVYQQFPRQNRLRWGCSGTTQFVIGLLPRETMVDIAESIDC
jgi:outer membrane lipoprotein-sorting protein